MQMVGIAVALSALVAAAPALAADAAEQAYYRGDYARAAALFFPEAEAGRAVAQSFLGYQYQYGLGLPKSYEEAAHWYHCAAEQGEPTAQFFLGQLYDRGQGVAEDPVQAGKWLDLAAAHAPPRQREYWATMRDTIDSKMSLDEVRAAQGLAVAWRPTYLCAPSLEVEPLRLPTKKYGYGEPNGER